MLKHLILFGLTLPVFAQNSGALVNAPPDVDINTAIVPRLAAYNVWTGVNVFAQPPVLPLPDGTVPSTPNWTGFVNYGAPVTPSDNTFLTTTNTAWAFYGKTGVKSIDAAFSCGQSGPSQYPVACGVWLYDYAAKAIYTWSAYVNSVPLLSLQRFAWSGPGSAPSYDSTFTPVQFGYLGGSAHLKLADTGAGYVASYSLDGGRTWADYAFKAGASALGGDYVFPQAYEVVYSQVTQ